MGGSDSNYQVIYRGESLENFREGEWVFFQRAKEFGGGYWFGRTYSNCFMLEFDGPTSLSEGIKYIIAYDSLPMTPCGFDDEFRLV